MEGLKAVLFLVETLMFRVAKFHGFGGLIRVKIRDGRGKVFSHGAGRGKGKNLRGGAGQGKGQNLQGRAKCE